MIGMIFLAAESGCWFQTTDFSLSSPINPIKILDPIVPGIIKKKDPFKSAGETIQMAGCSYYQHNRHDETMKWFTGLPKIPYSLMTAPLFLSASSPSDDAIFLSPCFNVC